MQQKATLPAEKPFLRLAVDRIFTPQNSGIAVWTEKKKNGVVCLLCQGMFFRSRFTGDMGGTGRKFQIFALELLQKEGLEAQKDLRGM